MSTSAKLSSGSDVDGQYAMIDEKKRKRMISNRESARRSRMRRQKHMEDLVNEKAELERKIHEDNQKYVAACKKHLVLESENKVLKAEKMQLSAHLMHLEQILGNHKEIDQSDHNLEVSETFLNLWQVHVPCSSSTRLVCPNFSCSSSVPMV